MPKQVSVPLDPVTVGKDRATASHVEERFNRFQNKNTFWRHNQNGTMVTCSANPDQPLTIFSYDILFNASGAGSVTYNSWTNADSTF